jgi:hypothetical protein
MRSQVLRAGQVANCRVSISTVPLRLASIYNTAGNSCSHTWTLPETAGKGYGLLTLPIVPAPPFSPQPPNLPPLSSNIPRCALRPQRRPRLPHTPIPQTAFPPLRSPARARLRPPIDSRRENLVLALGQPGGVATEQYEQWEGYPGPGQLEVEAGSCGYAGCQCADGVVAVYELWVGEDGGAC